MNSAIRSKRHTSHQRSCTCEYTFAAHPTSAESDVTWLSSSTRRNSKETISSSFGGTFSPRCLHPGEWRRGLRIVRRITEASICSSRVRGGDACAHDRTVCDNVAVISEFFTPITRNTPRTTVFRNRRVRHPIKHFAHRLQLPPNSFLIASPFTEFLLTVLVTRQHQRSKRGGSTADEPTVNTATSMTGKIEELPPNPFHIRRVRTPG